MAMKPTDDLVNMGGPVEETVRTLDMDGNITSMATRQVCWSPDGQGHHCDKDYSHKGDEHSDECCEHGMVTWQGDDNA